MHKFYEDPFINTSIYLKYWTVSISMAGGLFIITTILLCIIFILMFRNLARKYDLTAYKLVFF
jgi:hypothetical protein